MAGKYIQNLIKRLTVSASTLKWHVSCWSACTDPNGWVYCSGCPSVHIKNTTDVHVHKFWSSDAVAYAESVAASFAQAVQRYSASLRLPDALPAFIIIFSGTLSCHHFLSVPLPSEGCAFLQISLSFQGLMLETLSVNATAWLFKYCESRKHKTKKQQPTVKLFVLPLGHAAGVQLNACDHFKNAFNVLCCIVDSSQEKTALGAWM